MSFCLQYSLISLGLHCRLPVAKFVPTDLYEVTLLNLLLDFRQTPFSQDRLLGPSRFRDSGRVRSKQISCPSFAPTDFVSPTLSLSQRWLFQSGLSRNIRKIFETVNKVNFSTRRRPKTNFPSEINSTVLSFLRSFSFSSVWLLLH